MRGNSFPASVACFLNQGKLLLFFPFRSNILPVLMALRLQKHAVLWAFFIEIIRGQNNKS